MSESKLSMYMIEGWNSEALITRNGMRAADSVWGITVTVSNKAPAALDWLNITFARYVDDTSIQQVAGLRDEDAGWFTPRLPGRALITRGWHTWEYRFGSIAPSAHADVSAFFVPSNNFGNANPTPWRIARCYGQFSGQRPFVKWHMAETPALDHGVRSRYVDFKKGQTPDFDPS